ncbi:hypothetical protein [Acinetobacter sp.]|uniref:hypothetical protein n=1 Tax=Acinetobacter sp. TaxID=472 RepID=UPI002648BC9F|nr:hypothetical protein [Acinetobacter sp.]MDN5512810.1 hypothetical protein [Acinetobacter sp.]MDN5525877.1 hypothetical protein [Acinetobacter sp.]
MASVYTLQPDLWHRTTSYLWIVKPQSLATSPSTGILYQQPPSSEQIAKANKVAKVKAVLKEFAAISLIGITVVSTLFTVRSCSDDADRQAVQVVKFQMEVGK